MDDCAADMACAVARGLMTRLAAGRRASELVVAAGARGGLGWAVRVELEVTSRWSFRLQVGIHSMGVAI